VDADPPGGQHRVDQSEHEALRVELGLLLHAYGAETSNGRVVVVTKLAARPACAAASASAC
jgi:hypothetical protein